MPSNQTAAAAKTTGTQTIAEIDPAWAWAPYQPDGDRPWTLPLVGHLYRRAGFGANWGQYQRALSEGPQSTIDRLMHPEGDVAAFQAEYDRYDDAATGDDSAASLRAWWLRRMIETPHALQERMTLFWHGQMGISNARVKNGRLMADHIHSLRAASLGSYRDLLVQMAQDPAVFLGLDAATNRKARPSEHLARTMLECYGVGAGKANDNDVRDVARAFTGWTVLRGQLRYFEREHDEGDKTILGQRGKWGAQDAMQIIAGHPQTATFLVRKLYLWLVSETQEPDANLLAPLVQSFQGETNVGRLVETILRSNLFFSAIAYRQRIKSPVDFAIGILRGVEAGVATMRLGEDLARLGQDLYRPPTVKGWAGGRYWINAATMAGREKLAADLLSAKGPYDGKLDPAATAERYGYADGPSATKFLVDLFLQGDTNPPIEGSLADDTRKAATQIVCRPEFHLG